MHRGVYLLGPVPLTRSPEMAAAGLAKMLDLFSGTFWEQAAKLK